MIPHPDKAFCIFTPDSAPVRKAWGLSKETAWEVFYRTQKQRDETRTAFRTERNQLGYRAVELTWDELKKAQGWETS